MGEDDVLSDLGITAEESPIDVGAVTNVRVIILGGGGLEDLLDELLGLWLVGLLQKELDDGGENLQLGLEQVSGVLGILCSLFAYLSEFLHETIDETSEYVTSITDLLRIFSNDPYE